MAFAAACPEADLFRGLADALIPLGPQQAGPAARSSLPILKRVENVRSSRGRKGRTITHV